MSIKKLAGEIVSTPDGRQFEIYNESDRNAVLNGSGRFRKTRGALDLTEAGAIALANEYQKRLFEIVGGKVRTTPDPEWAMETVYKSGGDVSSYYYFLDDLINYGYPKDIVQKYRALVGSYISLEKTYSKHWEMEDPYSGTDKNNLLTRLAKYMSDPAPIKVELPVEPWQKGEGYSVGVVANPFEGFAVLAGEQIAGGENNLRENVAGFGKGLIFGFTHAPGLFNSIITGRNTNEYISNNINNDNNNIITDSGLWDLFKTTLSGLIDTIAFLTGVDPTLIETALLVIGSFLAYREIKPLLTYIFITALYFLLYTIKVKNYICTTFL
jgi:hypothetical protein